MRMRLEESLIQAAQQVAREMLASGEALQSVKLGGNDDNSSLTLSRSSAAVAVLHTFVVEGVAFYLGFNRSTTSP